MPAVLRLLSCAQMHHHARVGQVCTSTRACQLHMSQLIVHCPSLTHTPLACTQSHSLAHPDTHALVVRARRRSVLPGLAEFRKWGEWRVYLPAPCGQPRAPHPRVPVLRTKAWCQLKGALDTGCTACIITDTYPCKQSHTATAASIHQFSSRNCVDVRVCTYMRARDHSFACKWCALSMSPSQHA
jgi:hypothetical protein